VSSRGARRPPPRSRNALNLAQAQDATDPRIYIVGGQLRRRAGNPGAAVMALRRAVALSPGSALARGIAVMSLEAGVDAGYRILPSGRFAHHRAYLETVAIRAGLELRDLSERQLRFQLGAPVTGYLVCLYRRDTTGMA
jgi:hypothetical protein